MKIFAYILSFYMVALTLLPCVDLPEDNCVHTQHFSTQTSQTQHDARDTCSPFCSCNCCSSPLVCITTRIEIESESRITEFVSGYRCGSLLQPFASIWQPPKLG
jgi:hypothetical protein